MLGFKLPFGSKKSEGDFENALQRAFTIPGVRVARAKFLRDALGAAGVDAEQVERAIATTPHEAGVNERAIRRAARKAVRSEIGRSTALSTVAGIPGGLAMAVSIPADLAQYMAHVLRLDQKLAYLYSWPPLADGTAEWDKPTRDKLMTLFGVAENVEGAAEAAEASMLEHEVGSRVMGRLRWAAPSRQVARSLAKRMVRESAEGVVSKAIPLVGGAVSGGFTLVGLRRAARRLESYLADSLRDEAR